MKINWTASVSDEHKRCNKCLSAIMPLTKYFRAICDQTVYPDVEFDICESCRDGLPNELEIFKPTK